MGFFQLSLRLARYNAAMETIFKRYEKKYILTSFQYIQFKNALKGQIVQDEFGQYTVRNLYYDTRDFALIRHSLSHPAFKEKLRLRKYENYPYQFIELKKKFEGIVYKRRMLVHEPDLQIKEEIEQFVKTTKAEPKVAISYDREAFVCIKDPELRITFDRNVRFQAQFLDFLPHDNEQLLFNESRIIMEIKARDAIPCWLASLLSRFGIFPCSCSKYGMIYENFLQKEDVCSTVY